MKTPKEYIQNSPSHSYPTGHNLAGYTFYDEKTVIRAIESAIKDAQQSATTKDRVIEVYSELVKTYEAQPDDNSDGRYCHLWDERIRELHKELSELAEGKDELIPDWDNYKAPAPLLEEEKNINFYRTNILRHLNKEQMMILRDWLNSYDDKPQIKNDAENINVLKNTEGPLHNFTDPDYPKC